MIRTSIVPETTAAVNRPQMYTVCHNAPGEAPCPVCGQETSYHGEHRLVWCIGCRWELTLSPDDAFEYTKAIVGLSRMDRGAFLRELTKAVA